MHRAIVPCAPGHTPPCPEGDHFFASLDGEHFVEVDRLPRDPEDAAQVRRLLSDSRTRNGVFRPMTYARRYLVMQRARFL